MKRITTLFIALFLVTLGMSATVWTPKTVPIIHLQDSTRYVCNPEGILSQSACDEIDAIFRAVEDSTGVQALVAVLSGIDPDDCFEFSRLLGETVGVGVEGRDNGIVVVLSTTERDIRFSTGYGVEGVVTDALSKRIQVTPMVPYYRDDNWDEGMVEGMRELGKYLLDPELAAREERKEDRLFVILLLFLLCAPIALIYLGIRLTKKCPNCGKYKLKLTHTETLYKNARGKKVRYTYTCKNCNHQVNKDYYTSYGNSSGRSSGPGGGVIGGGHFGGGGGFGGGHYGGGHFGGGGAHTKF